MKKTIRPTYPASFSIALLLLIFLISAFLSSQIFDTPFNDLNENKEVYFGMFLAGVAVIIMIVIIWEEFMFPVKVKFVKEGIEFRNHRSKLIAQLVIYLSIPSIFAFIYFEYEVNHVRFFIWASICCIAPILEKIISGVKNYNDFLRLTVDEIEYKNNEKEGCFLIKNLQEIRVIDDERNPIIKIDLKFNNNETLIIDLDEMELEAFYDSIYFFITTRYKNILIR